MLLTMLNPFAASGAPVSGADARTMVKSKKAVLLDVREAQEVLDSGRAEGALNIPMGELASKARPGATAGLETDRPVIIYCATGARSGMAGKILCKLGYAEVHNMGTLAAWQSAGGRVTR